MSYAQQPRYASAPRMGGPSAAAAVDNQQPYASNRSLTPHRLGATTSHSPTSAGAAPSTSSTPTSSGLIRLTLRKPMGIVFEPMYDPHAPSVQRGVRICDLPRTGAAALSRKLEIGDELLQINETTVSRLSFDEIMDFIIEADPDAVNLLFRRPRKEALQARTTAVQGINHNTAQKDTANNNPTIKWKDEDQLDKKEKRKKRSKRSKSVSEEEETIQSSVADSSYRGRRRKHKRRGGGPYESESFLDLLIDTICSNSNPCRDTLNMEDEFSEEESLDSQADESTYVTYEESEVPRRKASRKPPAREEESLSSREQRKSKEDPKRKKKFEDDQTLETLNSADRAAAEPAVPAAPLGLAPPLAMTAPVPAAAAAIDDATDIGNPAPIKEVEYDEFDHNADVSVMESLGGPSLLIEKQRAAMSMGLQQQQTRHIKVPRDIVEEYGLDYPVAFGMSREQAIQNDPLKFYNFVVKGMLEEHEPEKVRLLKKLMDKYEGREDHLVQKLSVRYERKNEEVAGDDVAEENEEDYPEEGDELAFTDAVRKNKASSSTEVTVNAAKQRMNQEFEQRDEMTPHRSTSWPEKEEKEPDTSVNDSQSIDEESDYSGEDDVDGTSPAVIAQVSELLNYVYGKTSVPGQIDRVSTIMRAYEGREAVLLELLETKALIKANKEKENAGDLPAFLKNSSVAQKNAEEIGALSEKNHHLPAVTPMAGPGAVDDDISSMSGVSSPAQGIEALHIQSPPKKSPKADPVPMSEIPETKSSQSKSLEPSDKKKKGIFKGLFGRKKGKETTTPRKTPSSRRI